MPARPHHTVIFALLLLAAGCGPLGQVEQGLVVDYDPETGRLTLILDSNYADPGNPSYDRLPPVQVRVPQDPRQMGPVPDAGGLVQLDTAARKAVIFDARSRQVRTVEFELVSKLTGVYADDRRVVESGAPRVEPEQRTVTLYWPRTRELVTVKVPLEFAELPPRTWASGDEVRYYFKNPAQALRMMNVTKTKIT